MVNGSIQRKKSEEMEASYHRHDICDKVWALMELHFPGQRGQWGGIAQDNRRFINAVFWVLRIGAPDVTCRQIMGNGAIHQHFIRWRKSGRLLQKRRHAVRVSFFGAPVFLKQGLP